MHKLFKDRLFVIENGPGGVRWYTNGHFALSANVVAKARYAKGLKYLQELPAMRAGCYISGEYDAGREPPNVEYVIPKGDKLRPVRNTELKVSKFGDSAKSVFIVGDGDVLLVNPDYAALLDLATVLQTERDNKSPICGRLSDDGPIEILVMPIMNDGRVTAVTDGRSGEVKVTIAA